MNADKMAVLEIKIVGSVQNEPLSPSNYDIKEIISFLQNAEKLLYPNGNQRPLITYELKEGSVWHRLNASFQAVLTACSLLSSIGSNGMNVSRIEDNTISVLEYFSKNAKSKGLTYTFFSPDVKDFEFVIDKNTVFEKNEVFWINSEHYFYGKVVDLGGLSKTNLHLSTTDFGTVVINTTEKFLSELEYNIAYRTIGVRVSAKMNAISGELDKKSFQLIEILDYNPVYNETYLNSLIESAKKNWEGVNDADLWLQEYRGYEE